MGILNLEKNRKNCDFYYNSWGINLEEYAYVLEASKNNSV